MRFRISDKGFFYDTFSFYRIDKLGITIGITLTKRHIFKEVILITIGINFTKKHIFKEVILRQ